MPFPALPFRLGMAGDDDMELGAIRSVSFKVQGHLTLTDDGVHLSWTETRTVEELSLTDTGTTTDDFDDWIEFPWNRIAGVRVIGGWWRPRFEFRVWQPTDLADIPSAKDGLLPLRIARGDRALAKEIVAEVERRISGDPVTPLP